MRALLATALLATPAFAGDSVVHWNRKHFELGSWPSELPALQREVLSDWAPLCAELGYRMDLDPDGRVLLLSSDRHRSVRRQTDLVRKTLESFDERLPWVAPSFEPRGDAGDGVVRGRLAEPATMPVVLLRLDERDDMRAALEHLASLEPYLADWAATASDTTGFLVHQPRVAGWRDDDPDVEEWRPANELVHQLTQLLIEQRFGRAPHWLTQGLAWRVEDDVVGSLYSFPGRDGFVAIDAHDGWRDDLQKRFKKRGDVPVAAEDLAAWKPGAWDEPLAAQAWGVVTWLEKYREDALPGIVADLAWYREVHAVQVRDDGSWTMDPRYRVPGDVQAKFLMKHAGTDVLAECARFFEKGRGYRPPRVPRAR